MPRSKSQSSSGQNLWQQMPLAFGGEPPAASSAVLPAALVAPAAPAAPPAILLTSEQQAALAASGNVLLVAGAGTGKTRTLVERCVAWLLEEARGGSLDRMLMVTFTEAAAAEMRQRIRAALQERQQAAPEAARPAEQLALLDGAHIQTLHSFCLELVRRHFYELAIDPQAMVLDARQAALLQRQTLDALLERHYRETDERARAVQALIRERGRGWDQPVRDVVLRLHAHTRTLRDPASWLQGQKDLFASPTPAAWQAALAAGAAEWRAQWLPILRGWQEESDGIQALAELLGRLPDQPNPAALARALEEVQAIDDGSLYNRKGAQRALVRPFLNEAAELRGYLPGGDRDPLAEDWQWVRGQIFCLLEMAEEFELKYTEAKRAQAALDFQDLEQLALRLLYEPGTDKPTAVALAWRQKLDQVFVDEYQDINCAQDAILTALAREGADANRFLVGDIKQSIYRFRLADPRIFLDYAQRWREPGHGGQVLPLAHNFRSHEAILEFVNAVFRALMQREAGGIAYDDQAALKFGSPETRAALRRAADDPERRRVELRLLVEDQAKGEAGTSPVADRTRAEREAALVAARLRELKAQALPVWDAKAKAFRPVEWRDMVVLLRSRAGRAEVYTREFARLQVPLAVARGGFFACVEVTDLLNLLRLLDNPLQDLPLVAVLRSPLVGLSCDDLALIRATLRQGRLWTALLRWQAQQAQHPSRPEAVARVAQFLDRFRRWRELARRQALSQCLEEVLVETRYADWCRAQDRGAQRHANVLRLVEMARQYDPLQRQGLYRFLNFIEAQLEEELDAEPAPLAAENTVRLMTIHQSKGLEFPVVVLAGLHTRFNEDDLRQDVILDAEAGLCPKVKPPATGRRYPSVVHWFAARRGRAELLAEELRLLYVALTRASDQLILTAVASRTALEEKWPAAAALNPAHAFRSARCFLDWLGPWLQTGAGSDWARQPEGCSQLLRWHLHDGQAGALAELNPPAAEAALSDGSRDATPDAAAVAHRLQWQYAHPAATQEPGKTSVSVLRRRVPMEDDDAQVAARFLPAVGFERVRAGALGAADIGKAHHAFLELASFAMLSGESALRAEAQRLVGAGLLGEEHAAALDFPALAAFWNSETGLRLRAQESRLHREHPFTARLDAADLQALALPSPKGSLAGEFIVVQGVADLVAILDREIWILDYKTDAPRAEEMADKIRQYTPQLQIYGLALSRIYQRPVTRLWLHFLRCNHTVSLPAVPVAPQQ